MRVIESNIIFENKLPQLKSRQGLYPSLAELDDGRIASVFTIGEAMESVDCTSYITFSKDGGKTWSEPKKMFESEKEAIKFTDCSKISLDGNVAIAMGYAFLRENPNLPIGNPETGGLLDDFVFYAVSEDNGENWSEMKRVESCWGPHVEASAPLTVLKDGSWITPITCFPDWNGKLHAKMCGRVLRTEDKGKTWNDDSVCMDFGDKKITCYEQRMCQLDSGAIVCISWNEDTETGERLPNHYTVSYDNGKTWSKPESTGIGGQASSVCAIGGDKLLALHAVRRDTNRPGVYAYIVDLSDGKWKIEEELVVWEPGSPVMKLKHMAEIFAFLKFGQPGAILLKDGDVLMSHWYAQDGQYRTVATRIKL